MSDEQEEVVTGEVVPDENAPQEAKLAAAQAVLDKLRGDAHPSITQMDMVERMLPRELFPQYVAILTEKVQNDPYPSTELLERLQRLSAS
jgi:hypothetical protein